MFPLVHGIAAVDLNGNIEWQGKPIGAAFDEYSNSLDSTIIKNYCRDQIAPYDVVVVGENTWRKSGALYNHLHDGALIVSNAHGASVHTSDRIDPHQYVYREGDDSLAVLQQLAFKYALSHAANTIHVLGGVSVYRAFERVYTGFTMCRFHGSPEGASKRLEWSKKFPLSEQEVVVSTSTYTVHACWRSNDDKDCMSSMRR